MADLIVMVREGLQHWQHPPQIGHEEQMNVAIPASRRNRWTAMDRLPQQIRQRGTDFQEEGFSDSSLEEVQVCIETEQPFQQYQRRHIDIRQGRNRGGQ